MADTSVWIDHFRSDLPEMRQLLNRGEVALHPFIVAELALGSLRDRSRILTLLDKLPQVRSAQSNEVRSLIESRHLYGRGIGLIDAHLIAAVFINPSTFLWTRDKQLRKVAEGFGIHSANH